MILNPSPVVSVMGLYPFWHWDIPWIVCDRCTVHIIPICRVIDKLVNKSTLSLPVSCPHVLPGICQLPMSEYNYATSCWTIACIVSMAIWWVLIDDNTDQLFHFEKMLLIIFKMIHIGQLLSVHPSPKVMADFFQTQTLSWCPHPICTIFGGYIKCMQVFIFCAKYIEFLH